MSEFFRLVDLPTEERQILFGNRRVSEVVKGSVESSRNWANRNEELSIGAVVAPDTYAGFVEQELPESIPTIIKEHVANLLRYAEAVDSLFDPIANGAFSAFVFGAVRVVISAALKNMDSFLALQEQFEKTNTYLRRLDSVLAVAVPATILPSQWARIMIDMVRFCGHATKFIRGITLRLSELK